MSDIAIRVENLGKKYHVGRRESYRSLRESLTRFLSAPARWFRPPGNEVSPFWALREVSFEAKRGAVIGILGRNGAGKSTLLKILSRITEPSTGEIAIHGRVGSLLEVGTGFHPELTGRENIYLNGAILGMKRREIHRLFDQIVAFAEIEPFLDTPLKHYSSGMHMRLAFAVAAHLEPDILLVDEVLAVGDLAFQKKCLAKMDEVSHIGRTILFVSHQMNQIRRLCGHCLWLHGGRVQGLGPTTDVIPAFEAAMTSTTQQSTLPEDAYLSARFVSWRLEPPLAPHILDTFGPLTVSFTVKVNEPIRRGHHGVVLYDSEHRLIWAGGVDDVKLDRGLHQLIFRFPYLPLRPGNYTWDVTLFDDEKMLDNWNAVPAMIIATPPLSHPMEHLQGILNLPWDFQTGALDHSPA